MLRGNNVDVDVGMYVGADVVLGGWTNVEMNVGVAERGDLSEIAWVGVGVLVGMDVGEITVFNVGVDVEIDSGMNAAADEGAEVMSGALADFGLVELGVGVIVRDGVGGDVIVDDALNAGVSCRGGMRKDPDEFLGVDVKLTA